MEIPFYHDDVLNVHQAYNFSPSTFGTMMKKDLNLNLSDQTVANLKPLRDGDGILTSPDLGLLKLASPELEKLIIQSNGLVTTTPTTSQFLYPKVASEEQEFAEGFVKALEDLHKQNQLGVPTTGVDLSSVPSVVTLQPPLDTPVYANLSSYTNGAVGATVGYTTETISYPLPPSGMAQHPTPPPARLQTLKDEPQIVPEMTSFGDSPPLSPINMDTQERIKAERKRLRNRIAASKCRKRKLERISRLEEKVKTLKTQNTELASTANLLREQVAQLKQKVMSHVNSGCQLLPQQVQAY
ncbi:transcription factor JunD [Hyperolius riggenbachi]|uniref:transcription factor JunD n=1 Tax=Hyperolius riggenbachi TaxID=752182 RepID=UPI0035A265F1